MNTYHPLSPLGTRLRPILIFLTIILGLSPVSAKIWMPAIFDSGMVLQRETTVKFWGTASAGKTVRLTTSWNNKTYLSKADKQGRWSISATTPEAGGPYVVTVTDGEELQFDDVLIGEVWLCAGQSNM